MSARPIIGIDLGTTNCCVAVMIDDEIKIIPNENGENTTPSYVGFTSVDTLIGREAKDLAIIDPDNVVYDMKRIIGLKFNEPDVQKDIKRWPFKVINQDSNPRIKIDKVGKNFTPEQISAKILYNLKKNAEDYLGVPVKSAVITIPARFKMSQKEATIDAARIAGLDVKQLLIEPTAAALSYGVSHSSRRIRNVVVFDLGGGTFDVSIVKIEDKDFRVQATDGDTHLGGEDFDDNMVKYFVDEFKRKYNQDPYTDKKAIRRLKTACEAIKKKLSVSKEARINLDMFMGTIDLQSVITREQFEEVNMELFNLTIRKLENALRLAALTIDDIDDVVLAGGSTRILKVRQMLQDLFKGKRLTQNINPDEAVAHGAAIRATQLDGNLLMKEIELLDRTPFSIGIEDSSGRHIKMIEANTTFPTSCSKKWTNAIDYMDHFLFEIYEGEKKIAKENHFLGKFTVNNVPRGLRHTVNVDVVFHIDNNGILSAKGREETTGKTGEVTISYNNGRLSNKEIEEMISEAEKSREEDAARAKLLIMSKQIENFCYNAQTRIKNPMFKNKLDNNETTTIENACKDVLLWMEKNTPTEKQYKDKMDELEKLCAKLSLTMI